MLFYQILLTISYRTIKEGTVKREIVFLASPRKDGCWSVKKIGTNQISSVHKTQVEAWKETRRLARGAGFKAILKEKNGKISASNLYADLNLI
jgi:hypothetical protein